MSLGPVGKSGALVYLAGQIVGIVLQMPQAESGQIANASDRIRANYKCLGPNP